MAKETEAKQRQPESRGKEAAPLQGEWLWRNRNRSKPCENERHVSCKDYKAVAVDLQEIYTAATEAAAQAERDRSAEKWDDTYPQISKSWATHWPNLITLFEYPPEIRKVIYTTKPISP